MQRCSRVVLVLAVALGAGCGSKPPEVDGTYGPLADISYTSRDKNVDVVVEAVADVTITLASQSATITVSKGSVVTGEKRTFAGFQCVGPFKLDSDGAAIVTGAKCVMLDDRGAPKGDECKLAQHEPLRLTFGNLADRRQFGNDLWLPAGLQVDIAEPDATKCPLSQFSMMSLRTSAFPLKTKPPRAADAR